MRDHHTLKQGDFSIRVQQLSAETGAPVLTTILFDGVRLTHLLEVIENGGKVKIENQS